MAARFLIVGAGISGATLARALADAGHGVDVIDQRPHVAGNCHTEIDANTGILVHRYGPHIFHTDDDRVWAFLSRFTDFEPYRHRVMAVARGQMYRLPINLHTMSQVFGRPFNPAEAQAFLKARARPMADPKSFEDQALATVGREIYETFLQGYTTKQWGLAPSELPASVLARLPVRFSFDDNYFHHKRQAMPVTGYTPMVEAMLRHDRIAVHLNCAFENWTGSTRHTFYTGPIDRYFGYRLGPLAYRTLKFEEIRADGDFQGTAIINYCDAETPFTRLTEHKHLSPWRTKTTGTIAYRETSHDATTTDIPYYPVRLVRDKEQLAGYQALATERRDVTFLGRLGTYRYIDMDQATAEALTLGEQVNAAVVANDPKYARD